ncbi:hypothetical protein WJX84_007886 [Apatococcus fuscideae]|uniref:Uncharacterized protein n=1 Tax=Apatococcus fuscideae TaxID=2026836 RepID=A0AAW1TC51_9CHLO
MPVTSSTSIAALHTGSSPALDPIRDASTPEAQVPGSFAADIQDLKDQMEWLNKRLDLSHANQSSARGISVSFARQVSSPEPRLQQQPQQQLQGSEARIEKAPTVSAAARSSTALPKTDESGLIGPPLDHLDIYLKGDLEGKRYDQLVARFVLAYYSSQGGPWTLSPGAWLQRLMQRDFDMFIKARKAGSGELPRWHVVRHLLQISEACREVLKNRKQHSAHEYQAAMMYEGRSAAGLQLSGVPLVNIELPNGTTEWILASDMPEFRQMIASLNQQLQTKTPEEIVALESNASLNASAQAAEPMSHHQQNTPGYPTRSRESSAAVSQTKPDSCHSSSMPTDHMAEPQPTQHYGAAVPACLPASAQQPPERTGAAGHPEMNVVMPDEGQLLPRGGLKQEPHTRAAPLSRSQVPPGHSPVQPAAAPVPANSASGALDAQGPMRHAKQELASTILNRKAHQQILKKLGKELQSIREIAIGQSSSLSLQPQNAPPKGTHPPQVAESQNSQSSSPRPGVDLSASPQHQHVSSSVAQPAAKQPVPGTLQEAQKGLSQPASTATASPPVNSSAMQGQAHHDRHSSSAVRTRTSQSEAPRADGVKPGKGRRGQHRNQYLPPNHQPRKFPSVTFNYTRKQQPGDDPAEASDSTDEGDADIPDVTFDVKINNPKWDQVAVRYGEAGAAETSRLIAEETAGQQRSYRAFMKRLVRKARVKEAQALAVAQQLLQEDQEAARAAEAKKEARRRKQSQRRAKHKAKLAEPNGSSPSADTSGGLTAPVRHSDWAAPALPMAAASVEPSRESLLSSQADNRAAAELVHLAADEAHPSSGAEACGASDADRVLANMRDALTMVSQVSCALSTSIHQAAIWLGHSHAPSAGSAQFQQTSTSAACLLQDGLLCLKF